MLLGKLLAWLDAAVADYFTTRRTDFVAAADKQADGVSISVVLTHTTLMGALRRCSTATWLAAWWPLPGR